jgi:type VI secretion system secreted protein VgrG
MPRDKRALLSLTSPAPVELVPVRLVAHEKISELFRFEIDAMADSTATIDTQSMLNKPACLSVNYQEQPTRHFHGIISEFGTAGHTPLETRYRIVLLPQLAQTDLRIDCRMFFNKTAEDILKTIFNDTGVTKTAFRLYSQPTPRKATAQYNETSLHFVTRLMEEEGWYYFFEHASDGHTLVVTNDNNGFTNIPGATLRPGVQIAAEVLTDLHKPDALTHGKVGLRDYDPDSPSKNLKVEQSTVLKHGGTANRAVFQWPALTREISEAKDRAKRRMEAAEAAVSLAGATGSLACLFAGAKFKLLDDKDNETPHVVREISHFAEDEARHSDSGAISYSNRLTAFPNSVPWRQPMTTARPRMEGLHTAIVLAPAGEEIYTDKQGRVKIRFFWDWREDATADSSDWVRVVQPWGGNQWGGQFIPRVNTEVAVAFMDADPDRPVVVGGLYNGNDAPIFPVGEKTKLGFRSRSVLKGGTDAFNELSFDDKKGSEMLFLHAQKDMTTEVEHDQMLRVDNDRTVTITGDEKVTLKQGSQTTEVKLGDVSLKVDVGSITMEALQSITLKVGQSSVTLDQTGVTVKGMMISIAGQVQTEVKAVMTTVSGDAMLTLKGGITMIN